MAVDWTEWLSELNAVSAIAREGGLDAAARLRRARDTIDARYAERLDLDSLAREAAMSRYHFLRLFKREIGATPRQYLIERRIAAAKLLLETTDTSVTDVCLDVGFSSLGSFSTLFAKRVGCPPERYRRRFVQSLGVPVPPRIPACFLGAYVRVG